MAKRNGSLAGNQQLTKPLASKGAGAERLTTQTQDSNRINRSTKSTDIEFLAALNTGEAFDPKNPSTSLFKFAIGLTEKAWNQCLKRVYAEDFERAFWNILWPLKVAVERSSGESVVSFQAKNSRGKLINLKAQCGTFATTVPLIMIMTSEADQPASQSRPQLTMEGVN